MNRFTPSRSFYLPTGAVRVSPKGLPLEFYLYTDKLGRFCAVCFIGKAQKPSWRYAFTTTEKRDAYCARQIESSKASEESKAKRRAEANKPHGWEPGLILVSSWGYEQNNVDFFEVTKVIGKTMVEIEKIGSQRATDSGEFGHGMAEHVVPCPEHRTGKTRRCKVAHERVRIADYASASPWGGKPQYCSWYA